VITGMKTWRDATNPSSTYTYQFTVKTNGKDDVTIGNDALHYKSTDSLNNGYSLKYEGSGPQPVGPNNGHSWATFIHRAVGDTIYYRYTHVSLGSPPSGGTFVTP
jgi:hypothetical protein